MEKGGYQLVQDRAEGSGPFRLPELQGRLHLLPEHSCPGA